MNHKLNNKNIDYGLSFLRSILSFYVIRSHFLNKNQTSNKILYIILGKRRSIHVPTFFILSFYFNFKTLFSLDPNKNCKRFERLLIIFGFGLISPLYFQFCLIANSFFVIILKWICQKYSLLIFNFLMFFDYFIQYGKYIYNPFKKFRLEYHYSFDREIDMIPYAITGCNLSNFNIINYLKRYKFQTIIFSFLNFVLIDNFDVFSKVKPYYHYGGLKLNIFSICLILFFSSVFTLGIFNNSYLRTIIQYISRYTAGIYFIHMPVHSFFCQYLLCMKNKTIKGLFINYLISYSICHFGMLFFGKTKAKHLFS